MMLAALALDPTQMVFWLFLVVIGILIGLVIEALYAKNQVPGYLTWIFSGLQGGLPVVLNSYMDGWMSYKTMKKDKGSMVFNAGTDDEFLDRSVIDKKPMATLDGKRVMIRVTASAMPNSPDELADIQRVLDHIDENESLYPNLKNLQEFEVFGAMGHDPQTARELMAQNCQVETTYIDKDGVVKERPQDEVDKEVRDKVDAIFKEIELLKQNIKFLPRRSVFVDLARCVDATQLRIASQILKRYRAEVEALYRAKFGGAQDSLWKGLAIGAAIGAVASAIAVKLIGG
jgi:hypothetical protein